MATTPPAGVTFDFSKAVPIDTGAAIPKSASGAPATPTTSNMPKGTQPPPGVTFDFSKAEPVNPTPEYTRSRTLENLTHAMSGQPMAHPEDQAAFESGKEAGMESAAVQTAVSTGVGALAAPSVVTKAGPLVPAGRDALGKFLPWVASQVSEEGSSLARQGITAASQFAKDHPVAAVALGTALGKMGAGTAMHFLKKIGLLAEVAE